MYLVRGLNDTPVPSFDMASSLASSIPAMLSSGLKLFNAVQSDKADAKDANKLISTLTGGTHEQQVKMIQDQIAAQQISSIQSQQRYKQIVSGGVVIVCIALVGMTIYQFMRRPLNAN